MIVSGAKFGEELQSIVADELNVKHVVFSDSADQFSTYELKPQLRTLGPKYGALLGKIKVFLNECDTKAVVNTVRAGETYRVELDGREVELTEQDLLISTTDTQGYQTVSENGLTVVLDTTLTPELKEEGFVRELISKIQTTRKESGFEITDHIRIRYAANEASSRTIEKYADMIRSDTLCDALECGADANAKEWDVNGTTVRMLLQKM